MTTPPPTDTRFPGLAIRIRKALNAKTEAVTENIVLLGGQISEPDTNERDTEHEDSDYLFDETGIRVSTTTIEFGKLTYVLKHLASTKRIDKTPSRQTYQMGIAFTLFALFVLIVYIFTGQLTFGLGAVVYLSAGLIAFIISLFAYRQLKSSHTLVFKDARGVVIESVMRRDKAIIDRLEKAVKLAISRNKNHID